MGGILRDMSAMAWGGENHMPNSKNVLPNQSASGQSMTSQDPPDLALGFQPLAKQVGTPKPTGREGGGVLETFRVLTPLWFTGMCAEPHRVEVHGMDHNHA